MVGGATQLGKSRYERDSYLDVLRALAILSVIAVHTGAAVDGMIKSASGPGLPPLITGITDLGRFGVQLFFVLSGWLLENIYGNTSKDMPLKQFAMRRLARIYPLWLVFLALSFVLPFAGMPTGTSAILSVTPPNERAFFSAIMVTAAVTFTLWLSGQMWNTVIPGGWSIQVEIGHYFLYPLLRRQSVFALLLTLSIIRLITSILYFGSQFAPNSGLGFISDPWTRLGLYNSLIYFAFGLLIGRWQAGRFKLDPGQRWVVGLFILSTFINSDQMSDQLQKVGFISVCIALGYWLNGSSRISRSLSFVGKYSYFIYFFHFIALQLAISGLKIMSFDSAAATSPLKALACIPLVYVFALVISLIFGAFSWRFFENPLIRLSRKLAL